jgi:hypothetical protein
MAILIQCVRCNRKLRVQEHLLGKLIKCPNCQSKFQAEPVSESAGPSSISDPSSGLAVSEESTPAPGGGQARPAPAAVEALKAMKPASSPALEGVGQGTFEEALPVFQVSPAATLAAEQVASEAVADGPPSVADETQGVHAALNAEPVPPAPERFETSPFRVFGIVAAIVLSAGLVGMVVGCLLGLALQ